jgi:hypothetical protein
MVSGIKMRGDKYSSGFLLSLERMVTGIESPEPSTTNIS